MKIYYFIILVFVCVKSHSQQESYYSLYRYNMQVINPAFAGSEDNDFVTILNRTQWLSEKDSPQTNAFSFSSKRKNNVGLGLSVVSDKVFVERQTFSYVDFSYNLKLNEKSDLFLGLKAGGNFYRSSPLLLEDYVSIPDPSQQEFRRFNANLGVGLYINNPSYWVSFSIPRIFNVKRDDDLSIGAKDRVHSYLGTGLNLSLNKNFILKPAILLRKVVTLPLSADFSTFLSLDNKVDFGLSYRTNSSFSVMTFIKIFDNLNLGYAYEFPVETNLRNLSVNTHELLLQFRFRSSDNTSNKIEDLKNYNPLEKNFDRDNDQVLDQDDKCPDSPGPKSNFGCPLPPNIAFQNVRSNINDKADELKKLELQSTENDFSFLQTEEYAIYFDFDDFKIKGELNFSKLKKYIKLIKENQNLVFVIEGYSSSEGDENYNKKLSEQRALSVENFLIGSGISKNQIKIVGFGEDFSELSSSSSEKKKERKVKLNLLLKGN